MMAWLKKIEYEYGWNLSETTTSQGSLQTWWRHQMETFSALLALCAGIHRSPVNSRHTGQWRGTLMFPLICAWINGWANDLEADDLRRHLAHYDVIVIESWSLMGVNCAWRCVQIVSSKWGNLYCWYCGLQNPFIQTEKVLPKTHKLSHFDETVFMYGLEIPSAGDNAGYLLCGLGRRYLLLDCFSDGYSTPKRKCRHLTKLSSLHGCAGSCHFDNCQCNRWRKFRQNGNFIASSDEQFVKTILFPLELMLIRSLTS